MQRRTRQFMLFLVAVVLPAAAMSLLTFRYLRQDEEMARQLEPGQRRDAIEQAQRELVARLDTIRLQEINRRATAAATSAEIRPADSAIIFAIPLNSGGLVFPWETARKSAYPSSGFVSNRETGEIREFQSRDFAGAAAAYRVALTGARQPQEICESRLNLGRVLVKAGKTEEALPFYRDMLRTCTSALDDQGLPYALYAADRLIALKLDIPLAEDYLVRQVHDVRLRQTPQTAMIRSLLQNLGSETAKLGLVEIDGEIADFRQALALQKEFQSLQPLIEKDWVVYGADPWLLKLTPALPGSPLLFAISARKVAPPGTQLISIKTPRSYTLDRGFSGLEMELDPSRTFAGNRAPAALIAGGIGLILILTILSGYLFLHGVNRDLQMAEMRSHFIASVSHELKTPLTAIRMFAETLVLQQLSSRLVRRLHERGAIVSCA